MIFGIRSDSYHIAIAFQARILILSAVTTDGCNLINNVLAPAAALRS